MIHELNSADTSYVFDDLLSLYALYSNCEDSYAQGVKCAVFRIVSTLGLRIERSGLFVRLLDAQNAVVFQKELRA